MLTHYKKHFIISSLMIFISSSLLAERVRLTCPLETISFKVEVAQTPHDLAKGLMFRTHLKEDQGMLFLFSQSKAVTMWMKNTPLSLDMIFCTEQGKILAIHENATPYSLQRIGPVEGTKQVLEVKGGSVKKNGISKACVLTVDR